MSERARLLTAADAIRIMVHFDRMWRRLTGRHKMKNVPTEDRTEFAAIQTLFAAIAISQVGYEEVHRMIGTYFMDGNQLKRLRRYLLNGKILEER